MIIAVYKRTKHLAHVSDNPFPSDYLAPGDLVRHVLWPKSLGLVVEVVSDEVGVLWSRTNEAMRSLDDELDRIRRTL